MTKTSSKDDEFWKGAARAVGGAVLFSLPLLMTMEMWWLAFYMSRLRFALLVFFGFLLMVGLARAVGFKTQKTEWHEAVIDAGVAYLIGAVVGGIVLFAFGVLNPSAPWREMVPAIGLQAIPAGMGAAFARAQVGGDRTNDDKEDAQGFGGSFLHSVSMTFAGAVLFSLNLAPTEEMILIWFKSSPTRGVLLILLTLALVQGLVHALKRRETDRGAPPLFQDFLSYTLGVYLIAVAVSFYVLWTFGRFEGEALHMVVGHTIVLGFPAAIGGAAAREVV